MSNKTKTTTPKPDGKPALVPKLRFPEFQNAGGWVQKTVGDVSDVLMCKRIFAEETNPNEGVPFYKIGTLGSVPDAFISKEQFEDYKSRYNFPRKGEVLITCSGTVGKCLPYDGKDAYFQDSNIVWLDNPTGEVSNAFLLMLLSNVNWGRLNSTTITRIYGPDLRGMSIKFPEDEPEQHKIADCLSSVDDLIAAQARKLDALKSHKKGLMQNLFPREGETQPRLRFPEFQTAGEWTEEKLDDLLHFQDGFAFKSTDFVKSKEDVTQVIRITDINNKNTNEDKVYIPSAFLEANKLGKYGVDDGDLLLSLTGAAGFNFFFWNGGPATINQRTAKVTTKKKSDRALLRLLEPLIHDKINARGEGQNNNLSKEFMSSIVLVIPEPDEQQRIADGLTTLDNLIAAQTQKLEALKIHKKGLMQQLFPSPEEVEE